MCIYLELLNNIMLNYIILCYNIYYRYFYVSDNLGTTSENIY